MVFQMPSTMTDNIKTYNDNTNLLKAEKMNIEESPFKGNSFTDFNKTPTSDLLSYKHFYNNIDNNNNIKSYWNVLSHLRQQKQLNTLEPPVGGSKNFLSLNTTNVSSINNNVNNSNNKNAFSLSSFINNSAYNIRSWQDYPHQNNYDYNQYNDKNLFFKQENRENNINPNLTSSSTKFETDNFEGISTPSNTDPQLTPDSKKPLKAVVPEETCQKNQWVKPSEGSYHEDLYHDSSFTFFN